MKIMFISNYFNHHQSSVSKAMNQHTNGKYVFVETKRMDEERRAMGWGLDDLPSYVCSAYWKDAENAATKKQWREQVAEADVAIIGSAPESIIRKRILKGRLTFRYSERPLKRGNSVFKYVPRWIKWHINNPNNKPVYLLCASAYTALDYARFGMFQNKTYKWGYFPETIHYANIEEFMERKDRTMILWCGRFLDWKCPDSAIIAAKKLKDARYKFDLQMIGTGPMQEKLTDMVRKFELEDCVHFLGPKTPTQVRRYMETAGIYLFTSDRNEGWGAVLNESMNSGCAVVAAHEIGAVPFLVQNQNNGLIFEANNVEDLYEKIKFLLDNPKVQVDLGKAAYHTIVTEWNAETAAERLIELSKHILAGETYPDLYRSGPCSYAEIIEDTF